MSGFSPEWLALREPVDHRSRDPLLADRLRRHFAGRTAIDVVDLGCGTGSNLRGLFHLLPDDQRWTLVDYDARLIAAAREAIMAWADTLDASPPGGDNALSIRKNGKHLRVEFKQVDLNANAEEALGTAPDLVTAAAFFDLCSSDFIRGLAKEIAARRAAFFTVLTYNGQQMWSPCTPSDADMLAAFIRHQGGDKGFGPSTGPKAPAALAAAFRQAGYIVQEGDSPWRLSQNEAGLIRDLASGFAGAVAETGDVDPSRVDAWAKIDRTGAIVGHTDTLALPN